MKIVTPVSKEGEEKKEDLAKPDMNPQGQQSEDFAPLCACDEDEQVEVGKAIIRFFLFPIVPVMWALERILTPKEYRIGILGWVKLWITGDCAIPNIER